MLKFLNLVILGIKEAENLNKKYHFLLNKIAQLEKENYKLSKEILLNQSNIQDKELKKIYLDEIKKLKEENIKLKEENLKLKKEINKQFIINNKIYEIIKQQEKFIQNLINKNIKPNNIVKSSVNVNNEIQKTKKEIEKKEIVITHKNKENDTEIMTLSELKKEIEKNFLKEISFDENSFLIYS